MAYRRRCGAPCSAVVLPLEALGGASEAVREGRRVKAEQDAGRQSRETATTYAIFCGISTDKGKRVRLAARSAKPLRDMSRLMAQRYWNWWCESGGIRQVA